MDIQEKTHAFLNYTIGAIGISAPAWMQFLDDATMVMKFLTAAGGLALVIIQLRRTTKK